jgi:hypothetical protein
MTLAISARLIGLSLFPRQPDQGQPRRRVQRNPPRRKSPFGRPLTKQPRLGQLPPRRQGPVSPEQSISPSPGMTAGEARPETQLWTPSKRQSTKQWAKSIGLRLLLSSAKDMYPQAALSLVDRPCSCRKWRSSWPTSGKTGEPKFLSRSSWTGKKNDPRARGKDSYLQGTQVGNPGCSASSSSGRRQDGGSSGQSEGQARKTQQGGGCSACGAYTFRGSNQ